MSVGRARSCPVCGAVNQTCGPSHADADGANGVGVVITTRDRSSDMAKGDLKPYEVVVNGMRTVLRLSDEDAKRRGLTDTGTKKATPSNKARSASNKST